MSQMSLEWSESHYNSLAADVIGGGKTEKTLIQSPLCSFGNMHIISSVWTDFIS